MDKIGLILLVFAVVFASIAAGFPATSPNGYWGGRFHFGWLALAFFLLFILFGEGAKFVH